MRARYPDQEGCIERDGVRVRYEVHGDAETTIMLFPGWGLPLQSWKSQIPYLARHFRVIAFDPRGTGRSDRPRDPEAYALSEHVTDALQVMDAVEVTSVVVMGKSRGAQTAMTLAVDHAARVEAMILAAPQIPLSPWPPLDSIWSVFDEPSARKRKIGSIRTALTTIPQLVRSADLRRFAGRVNPFEAADRFSRHGMLEDWDGYLQWFQTQVIATDPHSTKQTDDLIGWLGETGPQAAADAFIADCVRDPAVAEALCARVRCPVLVIHGDRDFAIPVEWGRRCAEATAGQLFVVEGAGHLPGGRYPVVVNLAIRDFLLSLSGRGSSVPDSTGATP